MRERLAVNWHAIKIKFKQFTCVIFQLYVKVPPHLFQGKDLQTSDVNLGAVTAHGFTVIKMKAWKHKNIL